MDALFACIVLGVVAALVKRYGGEPRPVHHFPVYFQSMTGMIREPRAEVPFVAALVEPESAHQPTSIATERPVRMPDLWSPPLVAPAG